jgi:tetratricopeptide (TPR) repeat protein
MGTLFHNTSRFREAAPVLDTAVGMAMRVWGGAHPQTRQAALVLASTWHNQGRYDEAVRVYDQILQSPRDTTSADELLAVYVRQLRGETQLARGDVAGARATFARVVADGTRLFGKEHAYIALGMSGQARAYLETGTADSAEAWARRALVAVGTKVRPTHRYLLSIKRSLAEALGAQARYAEADSLFKSIVEVQRAHLPKEHVDLARTLHGYGALHVAMGNPVAAEPLLREALTIRRQRFDARHWEVGETQSVLGACLTALGRYEAAEAQLTQAYQVLRRVRPANDRRVRSAQERLRRVQRRVLAAQG